MKLVKFACKISFVKFIYCSLYSYSSTQSNQLFLNLEMNIYDNF
jgi:hypothetical protein